MCFFFFFSSRRRHTRFDCDWSSDVCSSDLVEDGAKIGAVGEFRYLRARPDDVLQQPEKQYTRTHRRDNSQDNRRFRRACRLHRVTIILPMTAAIETRLRVRSEEHTSELQSQSNLVCSLLLEK